MSERDPMEDFFRDRAEDYDYPFNEKDWDALEARLDRELPVRGSQFWGQVLAGILLVSIPWWPWTNEQPTPIMNGIATEAPMPIEASEEPVVESNSTQQPMSRTDNVDSDVVTYEQSAASSASLSSNNREPQNVITNEARTEALNSRTEISGVVLTSRSIWPVQSLNVFNSDINRPIDAISQDEDPISDIPDESVISRPSRDWKVWQPFIQFGGEYAGTQMDNSPQFGYRLGFGIRYQPLRYLSVSTGLNYANVGYTAYTEEEFEADYFISTGTNTPYGQFSWVDGNCLMLEVPIEVRWHPLKWLNVGTGIRNYFVQSEIYDAYYNDPVFGGSKTTYTNASGGSFWAAHLMFNVGFDIPVGRNTIELQPFYQIPLKPVGSGNVEWRSAGITARYLF